jgi:hypothetical protein
MVMAINRKDGKVAWQQTAREVEPHEAAHNGQRHLGFQLRAHRRELVIAPFESQGASMPTT